ncbi:hypothetical protein E1091_13575 [Micromonospora fluostatini]|uniref:Transcriptional regulator n=1 Tax=Micromonospora fluostatini TaxID=1629071 RepID=A0ABY2DFK4_9ACTN|nr:hypothetical protein E1091_13575 [Micromonospora fluostatini]
MTFTDREILATATHPDFRAWLARIRHIGGCQHPVHLVGHTLTVAPSQSRHLIPGVRTRSRFRLGRQPGPAGVPQYELVADSADVIELAEPFELKLPVAAIAP